ncbi:MAG: hypothetical protein ABI705_08825 [Aestuariivirga sp.]
MFASLSSAAKAITSTNWNGNTFFGLGEKRGAMRATAGKVFPCNPLAPFAVPSTPEFRPTKAASKSSTRSMPSGKHQKPISRVRPMKGGFALKIPITMVDIQAAK